MTGTSTGPTPAEVYERVLVPAMFEPLARLLIEVAKPRAGEAVLDLACGTGVVARAVAPLVGPTGSVIALDLRPGMLAVARGLPAPAGTTIEWVEGDATAMALADDQFDLVLCQQGLQFFEPRERALAEVGRVLRPGGRFAAAVWAGIEHLPLFAALAEIEARHLEAFGITWDDLTVPFQWGDPDAIERAVTEARFSAVEVRTASVLTDFDAATFIRDVEFGYQAVVPVFQEDAGRFEAFVRTVEEESRPVLDRFRVSGRLRAPARTNLVSAVWPA